MPKQTKKSIAELVRIHASEMMNGELRLDIDKDWVLYIKKNILDDVLVEYRYEAFNKNASMRPNFPFLQPGDKGVHMGYYYPSEDTLHILC
jgi:hypothetical protein